MVADAESGPPEAGATVARRSRITSFGLPAAGAAGAIALWWLVTVVFSIRPFFLPAPLDVVEAIAAQPEYLARESWVTFYETLAGFMIAVVAGLLVAVLLAAFDTVDRAVMPLLVALNSVPKVALAPLLVVWLGFGPQTKIVMVVLICFFPIVVATMGGLSSTPADLIELARSLSASRWQTFVKIRIMWALPQVFVGMKVAISLAIVGAIVAEIANPSRGLGAVIVMSGSSADTPLAFAALTLLAVISVGLFYLIVALERRLLPWARKISG